MTTAQNAGPGTAGKAHIRAGGTHALGTYFRYDLARQRYSEQRRYHSIAGGTAPTVSRVRGRGGRIEGLAGTGGGPGQGGTGVRLSADSKGSRGVKSTPILGVHS